MNKHVASETDAARAEFEALRRAHPDIVFLDAVIADIGGVLRGKRVVAAEAPTLFAHGMQIPLSLHLMDARGQMTNPGGRGMSDGDPDGTAWPIPGTIRPVWGSDPPRAQMLMQLFDGSGAPLSYDPRAILQRVLRRFDELALTPVVALELEFYLLDQVRSPSGRPQPPVFTADGTRDHALSVYDMDDLDRHGGFAGALAEAARMQRVPVTTTVSEYAPGQFEANLRHEPDAALAADHAVFLRQIVKAAASKTAMSATFMAKPYGDLAGSGMHLHLSLAGEDGRNVFDDGTETGSALLRFAAGGLSALMGDSMAFFAPNVNSYRRFAPDMFAPVNRSWAFNNRTAGLRVPAGSRAARRIEHRCAGADANPYLVTAAVLAGAHYGIVNQIDPGPPGTGNLSLKRDPSLPATLEEAVDRLRTAPVLRDYLGGEAVDIYREIKAVELQRVRQTITAEEYDWYL